MRGLGRFLLVGVLFLTACAAERVSPADPTPLVPDHSTAIRVGQTARAEVRQALGVPALSSAHWGFDLFRASTEQRQTAFAITPWPVPFARFTDQLQRYTLVSYDAQLRASAVATGLFRRPTAWRNVSPIRRDFPALHLRAGELMFFVDPEGAREVNLLASPLRRDAFLRDARALATCTAVLGCGDQGCPDQLAVDAGPTRRLPLRTAHVYWLPKDEKAPWLQGVAPHDDDSAAPWLEALVAVTLPAGEHELKWSAKHLAGSTNLRFMCRPATVSYLVIHATANASFWKPALVEWRIEQSSAMPERFARRPLVLLDDGQWQVDAEPILRAQTTQP